MEENSNKSALKVVCLIIFFFSSKLCLQQQLRDAMFVCYTAHKNMLHALILLNQREEEKTLYIIIEQA